MLICCPHCQAPLFATAPDPAPRTPLAAPTDDLETRTERVARLLSTSEGMTARTVARALWPEVSSIGQGDVERARRALERLVISGRATRRLWSDGTTGYEAITARPSTG